MNDDYEREYAEFEASQEQCVKCGDALLRAVMKQINGEWVCPVCAGRAEND